MWHFCDIKSFRPVTVNLSHSLWHLWMSHPRRKTSPGGNVSARHIKTHPKFCSHYRFHGYLHYCPGEAVWSGRSPNSEMERGSDFQLPPPLFSSSRVPSGLVFQKEQNVVDALSPPARTSKQLRRSFLSVLICLDSRSIGIESRWQPSAGLLQSPHWKVETVLAVPFRSSEILLVSGIFSAPSGLILTDDTSNLAFAFPVYGAETLASVRLIVTVSASCDRAAYVRSIPIGALNTEEYLAQRLSDARHPQQDRVALRDIGA